MLLPRCSRFWLLLAARAGVLCAFCTTPWALADATDPGATAQPALFPAIAMGGVAVPVVSMRQARLIGTMLQQYDFSCGSAAIATLLTHHYRTPVSEQQVFESMYLEGDQAKIRREGFSYLDMKRYLARLGFTADGFEQPLDKLNDARIPALALINEKGYQHFVVIKGVQADRVLIGDPAQGTRAMPRREFEALWSNRLLFVIHNRMEQAGFNRVADWRAAPRAPMHSSLGHDSLSAITLPKHGPGGF